MEKIVTKEEINAKIQVIKTVINKSFDYNSYKLQLAYLEEELKIAKSIDNLITEHLIEQRQHIEEMNKHKNQCFVQLRKEAFEAGRSSQICFHKEDYDYETFEDYLESKENGTTE
jgi:isopropylmalate/homocitrate/citramalate synthase